MSSVPAEDTLQVSQGYQALYHNVFVKQCAGYAVLSGCSPSISNDQLAIDISAGTVMYDGDVVEINATTINLTGAHPDNPRKDVIVYDGSKIKSITGTAEAKDDRQPNAENFKTVKPSPPDLENRDVTPIVEVYVPAGVADISSSNRYNDLRIGRVNAFGHLDLQTADIENAEIGQAAIGEATIPAASPLHFASAFDVYTDGSRLVFESSDGQQWVFDPQNKTVIPGDVDFPDLDEAGLQSLTLEDLTSDSVEATMKSVLPVYADNANAVAQSASMWLNDGSGPDPAGLYYYDNGIQGPLATGGGSAPGALSGLDIDTDKNWGGFVIEGAGHDGVRVPSSVERVGDDFEGGTLPAAFNGRLGMASVQSTVALEGGHSLQLDPQSDRDAIIHRMAGSNMVQPGDEFEVYTQISGTDDVIRFCPLLAEGLAFFSTSAAIFLVDASTDNIEVGEYISGNNQNYTSSNAAISNYTNERLRLAGVISEDKTTAELTVYDSTDTEIATVTTSLSGDLPDSGGYQYYAGTGSANSTIYTDGPFITRRTREYVTETAKGTTELGNEIAPSGGVHTGPAELPANAERGTYQSAPVTADATQGTESILTLVESGLDPAVILRRVLDGQGGAYGHQLDGALGRFARLNANLGWEYETLSDVPNWVYGGGGSYTFQVTGRPRRAHISHVGSGGAMDGLAATALTTYQSLGGFRVTFKDVSFTENGTDNRLELGISNASVTDIAHTSGNGIVLRASPNESLVTVSAGSPSFNGSFSIDWTSNHDISIEYDGSEARLLIDGSLVVTTPYSVNADFRPLFQLEDSGNVADADTAEVGQVSVEPLSGVLQ